MLMTAVACSENDIDIDNDMPDEEFVVWDISPTGVIIQLVDEAGNNLLDPEVNGNWVDEPMWMGWENKEPHFDDHITYNGKRIEGNKLTLVLPKNNQ